MNYGKTRIAAVIFLILIVMHSSVAVFKTFTVQETDLVTISPEAMDPDDDSITYTYSLPLNQKGQWQTGYDDAGEYLLKITASDGINQSIRQVLLIVENKNQAPYLLENKVAASELETIDLKKLVADPDNDALQYSFDEPFDKNGLWTPGENDQGNFVTNFKVSDAETAISARVEVEVSNTDQPPVIKSSFSEGKIISAEEDEEFSFHVDAEDVDDDKITYSWKLDGSVVSEENKGDYQFGYDGEGKHNLRLRVSDNKHEVIKEWVVDVKNVNRKPELALLPIIVKEGETVTLPLPAKDADGDVLSYSFDKKFINGSWNTSFDDAGEYSIPVYVSDGKEKVTEKVKITVLNVDRSPQINLPSLLEVSEGQVLSFKVDAHDPDGDKVIVSFENAPEGALFDQENKLFSWKPGYDFIVRRGGLFSNLLNALRIENRLITVKRLQLDVSVCSGALCAFSSVPLRVYNTNRAPLFEPMQNLTLTETEFLTLSPSAVDPDGDIVRYYFSRPLKRDGTWQTDYESSGVKTVEVIASDGFSSLTSVVNVNVLPKNRQPEFKLSKDKFTILEGQEFSLAVAAIDPDGDNLSITAEDMPDGSMLANGTFSWKPGFREVMAEENDLFSGLIQENDFLNRKFSGSEAVRWINFIVSDGEFEVRHPVKIIVKDVNKKPAILDYIPSGTETALVHQPVVFKVTAADEEGEKLTYTWE
ncbi:MAG: hypothetical protein AABX05_01705, partial [Nanoarchaeota archaeon]